ncbi:unnamed protein product, partial [Ectocarpus fasciculatus]
GDGVCVGDTGGGWAEEVEMAIDDGQVHGNEKAPHPAGDATTGVSTTSEPATSGNSCSSARGGGKGGGRGKGKRGAGGSGGA